MVPAVSSLYPLQASLAMDLPDLVALQIDPREFVHQLQLGVEVLLQSQECL